MKEFLPGLYVSTKELEDGTMIYSMESSVELDEITVEFAKLQHYMQYYIRCLALVHFHDWSKSGVTISPNTGQVIHDDRNLLFGMGGALTFEQYKRLYFGKRVENTQKPDQ